MKKIIFTALIALSGMMILQSFNAPGFGKKDGTEPGYTGSPGDTLKNCTYCHGGTAVPTDEQWISSNVPSEGYTPGATYTIKAMNIEFGATRFGFEVSPQALNGDLLGTMVITDTARTKLVGNDKYITYREAGVDGVDSLSWTFNWIAPPAGTGDVVFYGAFNSNWNGHKEGDKTFLSTLTVHEAVPVPTGLDKISDKVTNLLVYPNPADDNVNISFDLKTQENDLRLKLVDLTGKQVMVKTNNKRSGTITESFNTANLPNGIYLLQANEKTLQKINVGH
jgi:hypothetical protein